MLWFVNFFFLYDLLSYFIVFNLLISFDFLEKFSKFC